MDQVLDDPTHIVNGWLAKLEVALSHTSPDRLEPLFQPTSYWRDAVALTWSLETYQDAPTVADRLWHSVKNTGITSWQLDESAAAPQHVDRVGRSCIEAFLTFETAIGRGRGILRLAAGDQGDGTWRAWTLLTALQALRDHEETTGANRPVGQSYSRDFQGPNWLDKRLAAEAFADRDPTVLVVGGGQAGLSIAARLTQLGVDTLIIDRHERIGDNWRKRYHALTLHNQVHVNHLPYLPFPPNWPVYIPKDKLANWFEFYADAMELNFWTGHALVDAIYDQERQIWSAILRRTDGSVRTLHPRHIVMATGVSGIPNMPALPGLGDFAGEVVHSSQYGDGEAWNGKSAIVIGSGNSGHDVAQDLASSSADVTLVQRSSTLIVSIEPSAQLPYVLYDGSRSLEDTDLIAVSMPMPLMREAHIGYTKTSREMDSSLLAKLEAIGFKLDPPEDHAGWQFKYLTRGGGYYFNVGCSDMLIDGQIKLLQFSDIDCFTTSGFRQKNGTETSVDLVVLATGYRPQEELVERLFGPGVRDRVGPIWGFGDELELRNMYTRTGQPGLWFIEGSFAQCRINSKYLALQIKACEVGLLPLERPSES
ncbi:MAG: NAD(P)/FAD-dependent oxidoreductase [Pseudomonadota bacterium]